MDELYIGLMSGTSIDGIDAVLVDFSQDQFKLIGTHYQAYPEPLRATLLGIVKQQSTGLAQLMDCDHEVAVVNALAIKKLLQTTNIATTRIKAVGFHGQTLFHQPQGKPNSLQIGDPNFLAQHSGMTVVTDFRRRDMAVGGQGAPLVPLFHEYLFRDSSVDRAILNLGGIANLTLLAADQNQATTGFDTGPASCLLDDWIAQHQQKNFDEQGQWAKQGQLIPSLLEKLLSDPYFDLPAPKSTGREYFHLNWLNKHIGSNHYAAVDVQTTLTHLTAQSIASQLLKYAPKTQQVFVCGGGVQNAYLLALLQQQLSTREIASTQTLGLHPDWVEACAFAWLAKRTYAKQPGNLPSVTGASQPVVLGGMYF